MTSIAKPDVSDEIDEIVPNDENEKTKLDQYQPSSVVLGTYPGI